MKSIRRPYVDGGGRKRERERGKKNKKIKKIENTAGATVGVQKTEQNPVGPTTKRQSLSTCRVHGRSSRVQRACVDFWVTGAVVSRSFDMEKPVGWVAVRPIDSGPSFALQVRDQDARASRSAVATAVAGPITASPRLPPRRDRDMT